VSETRIDTDADMPQFDLRKAEFRSGTTNLLASDVFNTLVLRVFQFALQATHMIFETTFWIVFVAASRMIAKAYDRRRDVLYGPYLWRTDRAPY
jgi:hypothetical protein